jgi:hypothetical protein
MVSGGDSRPSLFRLTIAGMRTRWVETCGLDPGKAIHSGETASVAASIHTTMKYKVLLTSA